MRQSTFEKRSQHAIWVFQLKQELLFWEEKTQQPQLLSGGAAKVYYIRREMTFCRSKSLLSNVKPGSKDILSISAKKYFLSMVCLRKTDEILPDSMEAVKVKYCLHFVKVVPSGTSCRKTSHGASLFCTFCKYKLPFH